eukprot:2471154-Amphidinium_carterae.2
MKGLLELESCASLHFDVLPLTTQESCKTQIISRSRLHVSGLFSCTQGIYHSKSGSNSAAVGQSYASQQSLILQAA